MKNWLKLNSLLAIVALALFAGCAPADSSKSDDSSSTDGAAAPADAEGGGSADK